MEPTNLEKKISQKISENKLYNENILKTRHAFDEVLFDGNVIVRLIKVTKSVSDLDDRKFKTYETEGGKVGTKVDDYQYTTMGVVIKKPTQDYIDNIDNAITKWRYNALVEGETIVLLNPGLTNSSSIAYFPDRNEVVHEFEGYVSVSLGMIQSIKNTKNEL